MNPEGHLFRQAGQGHLVIRKVYGRDGIRLLRCCTCGAAFSERRGSALCNTKLLEAKAEEVITHRGEGCSVRATARLVKVCQETAARLLRVSGRHAERVPDQHVRALQPMAVECDKPWSFVKNSQNAAPIMYWVQLATGGIIPLWPRTASWWCP